MKIIAYFLIIIGSLFSLGMIYVILSIPGWQDLIIGWLFLGPLPLILGTFILKKINGSPILNFFQSKRK